MENISNAQKIKLLPFDAERRVPLMELLTMAKAMRGGHTMVITNEKWRLMEKRESAEVLAMMIESLTPMQALRVLRTQYQIGNSAMQAVLNDVLPSLGVLAAQLIKTSIMDANVAIAAIDDHATLPRRRLTIAYDTILEDMG